MTCQEKPCMAYTDKARLVRYSRDAWHTTRRAAEMRWQTIAKVLVAVPVAALLSFLHLSTMSWKRAVLAALAAGMASVVLLITLTLLSNLATARKRERKTYSAPAGMFGRSIIVTGGCRGIDIMQQEAALIAIRIEEYMERRSNSRAMEQPRERTEIQGMVASFGGRAKADEFITRKSRRRSLKLYEEISASNDFDSIRRRCREFQMLKPSY